MQSFWFAKGTNFFKSQSIPEDFLYAPMQMVATEEAN